MLWHTMATGLFGVTALDVTLEAHGSSPLGDAASLTGDAAEPISLLRCIVLTRHLDNIIGAIQRTTQHKAFRSGQLFITTSQIEVNGHAAEVLTVEGIAQLKRLREQLLKAITPGTIVVDASPSVSDFQTARIGPILCSDLDGRRMSRSAFAMGAIGIYKLEKPGTDERTLLRRCPLPLANQRVRSRRQSRVQSNSGGNGVGSVRNSAF